MVDHAVWLLRVRRSWGLVLKSDGSSPGEVLLPLLVLHMNIFPHSVLNATLCQVFQTIGLPMENELSQKFFWKWHFLSFESCPRNDSQLLVLHRISSLWYLPHWQRCCLRNVRMAVWWDVWLLANVRTTSVRPDYVISCAAGNCL